jgi:hypothetical protein
MHFSPQAPAVLCGRSLWSFSVVVLCVLRAFVVNNPFSVAVLHPSSFIPHPSSRFLLATRPPNALTVLAPAPMYGTNIGHFQPSAPPPSLLLP